MELTRLGTQIIIEYFNCDEEILRSPALIQKAMEDAARHTGAHIVQSVFHHFNPHGVSGAVIISESHLAIHTWPEYGYASVDVYTCGDTVDPWKAYSFLKEAFRAEESEAIDLPRGTFQKIKLHNASLQKITVK